MKILITSLFLILPFIGLFAQNATPLSEAEFEVHRAAIEGQSFDSKRLIKAKELSDAQYLQVGQIEAILKGFSLEGNKLAYAKYAYSTTLDAENFPDLIALFRLSTSKEDLKNFLSKRALPVVPKVAEKELVVEEEVTIVTEELVETTSTTVKVRTGPSPMDDPSFNAAKRAVSEESFESAKLRRVKQISDANYLLSSQVKELLDLLSFESSKLEYAKHAYDKTYDQANYDVVKEGLRHSKSKETITAFLKNKPVQEYEVEEEVITTEITPTNTNTTTTVVSTTTAPTAMSNGNFINAKTKIISQTSDAKKLEEAKAMTDKNNLSTEQVKAIVEIFLFEENRFKYAKHAYPKTVDQDNYGLVVEALEKDNHKLLQDYIKNIDKAATENTLATGPSELSSEDFEALKKKLKGLALESHRFERAKTIVDRSKVSAMQVKQINELFELEETRLEFAQYAYTKTLNPEDYEIVRDSLNKSTSKYTLDRFIKEKTK
jgi:inosine/xanthosine triphosphate pyrophosphatase family protein